MRKKNELKSINIILKFICLCSNQVSCAKKKINFKTQRIAILKINPWRKINTENNKIT